MPHGIKTDMVVFTFPVDRHGCIKWLHRHVHNRRILGESETLDRAKLALERTGNVQEGNCVGDGSLPRCFSENKLCSVSEASKWRKTTSDEYITERSLGSLPKLPGVEQHLSQTVKS